MDSELRDQALDWAEKVIQDIEKASSSAEYRVEGDSKKALDQLNEWEWLDSFPLDSDQGRKATKTHLAIQKYGKLKWKKENPPKKQASKWEKVVGKMPRR